MQADFDVKLIPRKKYLPLYYIQALKSWSKIVHTTQHKEENLWYNKKILVDKKPAFIKSFNDIGINRVSHFLDPDNSVIPFESWVAKGLHPGNWLKWRSLLHAIIKAK